MATSAGSASLSLLSHPYCALRPLGGDRSLLKAEGRRPGCALVWRATAPPDRKDLEMVNRRPGGLALLVVLPPASEVAQQAEFLVLVTEARPQSILPFHEVSSPRELAQALRRPPEDLAVDVTDYLAWRGIRLDQSTRHIVRKIVELSADLRSVTALSRSLYISRRALGRRFMRQGLPVPSHWLHFARLLRVAIRLQNTEESVLSLGYDLGYSDGFSLSNQMARLMGQRPSDARRYLGWEWLMEAWLRREADTGGLAPSYTERLLEAAFDSTPASMMRRAPSSNDRRKKVGRTHKAAG